MTNSETIRATVSPKTIEKASRLFNGTILDIANEIFQNARRAGATLVTVDLDETRKPAVLTIRDDGKGIADPRAFVTLGHSNWDSPIQGEDPAGMGAFALSATTSTITSRSAENAQAWQATIDPTAWSGQSDINIGTVEAPIGTTIQIDMTMEWLLRVKHSIATAAKHYPIPVTFNGDPCQQADWLGKAIHRKTMDGYEIGVLEERLNGEPNINFHGLTMTAKLPSINEIAGTSYTVRVDMEHTAGLELVLPARKEVIENDAFTALKHAATIAIFEAIAKKGAHTLTFEDWNAAFFLGVELPEATASLHTWSPPSADSNAYGMGEYVTATADTVIVPQLLPSTANALDFALQGHPLRQHMMEAQNGYIGYPWYDKLSQIDNIQYEIQADGKTTVYDDLRALDEALVTFQADKIDLAFDCLNGEDALHFRVGTPIALLSESYEVYDVESVIFAWTPHERLTSSTLCELLIKAYFDPSEDSDANNYNTQYEAYEKDAQHVATSTIEGEDAAIRERVHSIVSGALWTIPRGKHFTITIDDRSISVVDTTPVTTS